jgi:hypothetical protein
MKKLTCFLDYPELELRNNLGVWPYAYRQSSL